MQDYYDDVIEEYLSQSVLQGAILTLAAAAHAQTFFLQDTPEVSSAKFAHFNEHAKAAARVGAPLQDVYKSFTPVFAPAATPVVTSDGFIAETPEVASLRAAHLAEHARIAAATAPPVTQFDSPAADPYAEYRAYYNRYYANIARSSYTGPQAVPTVLPSGFLADTPEVANAKATHLYKLYQESNRF